ncbi:hypothetical protein E2562_021875 [Oryza meyeriana var. granulata]|uniref:Reverse transcriptase Ty1/copia-type domain-containing protein n=1 Tax=Oryza meyeriana var. granulata TaxID=110450 RepID=A0A6G1C869_9ORYZ|nr:hypothetical protein E2562_021875 [Oryza meyeriana var. granulata]
MARLESVRMILAVAAHEDWQVHHMDVKSAFLNGELKEEVYVQQPPGFAMGKAGQVLKLSKTLYRLRQAPAGMECQAGRLPQLSRLHQERPRARRVHTAHCK